MQWKDLAVRGLAFTACVAVGATSCGDDDGDDGIVIDNNNTSGMANNNAAAVNNNADPAIAACQSTIADKEALPEVAAVLAQWSIEDATEMVRDDGDQATEADYAGFYRDDLANHPGCAPRGAYGANTSEPFVLDNEATVATGTTAEIAGYPCAAKVYDQANEDTSKPIVILVHGNSSGVTTWEAYFNAAIAGTTLTNAANFEITVDSMVREQLASTLVDDGYRVIAFDARVDLVGTLTDYSADQASGNPFLNIDHGWAVPMLQSLLRNVMTNNATRKVSVIGHSLGATVVRDALRRMYVAFRDGEAGAVNPYANLQDVILLSGANHGVSTAALLCPGGSPVTANMRSTVTCEMGDRTAYVPTYFTNPINGPRDLFSTPCADGSYAYGETDQCSDNVVQWTTVTMEDIAEGALQDEFVSEASSSLDMPGCVTNQLITLADFDTSGYYFTGQPGIFANHFGSARSNAGLDFIVATLAD